MDMFKLCSFQDEISDWFSSLAECLEWNVRKKQQYWDDLSDEYNDDDNDNNKDVDCHDEPNVSSSGSEVGESEDDTLDMIHSIKDKKVRIIESKWNDGMRDRGYVYGQQKMIAQFNCTGDWAFYIEGD